MKILNKIKTAVKNPSLLLKYLQTRDLEAVRQYYRETHYSSRELADWKPPSENIQKHYRIITDSVLEIAEDLLPQKIADVPRTVIDFEYSNLISYHGVCYMLCRLIKPTIVVETGVANGFSSYSIIRALDKNENGALWSIDYPPTETFESGWMCKNQERPRWNLISGKSSDKLLKLLSSLKKIDCFFHDSDHSYKNELFEYRLAWEYLRKGGVLFSDDINDAIDDFVKGLEIKPQYFAKFYTSTPNGIIIK